MIDHSPDIRQRKRPNGGNALPVNSYEAMFVVDSAKGGSEFAEAVRHISGHLSRHNCQIERIEKWEERKLAFPIKHVKRGIYVLVYFNVDGAAIAELRRDIALSEDILRVLILRAEGQTPVKGELYSPEGELLAQPARTEVPAEVGTAGGDAPKAPAPAAPAADAPEEDAAGAEADAPEDSEDEGDDDAEDEPEEDA